MASAIERPQNDIVLTTDKPKNKPITDRLPFYVVVSIINTLSFEDIIDLLPIFSDDDFGKELIKMNDDAIIFPDHPIITKRVILRVFKNGPHISNETFGIILKKIMDNPQNYPICVDAIRENISVPYEPKDWNFIGEFCALCGYNEILDILLTNGKMNLNVTKCIIVNSWSILKVESLSTLNLLLRYTKEATYGEINVMIKNAISVNEPENSGRVVEVLTAHESYTYPNSTVFIYAIGKGHYEAAKFLKSEENLKIAENMCCYEVEQFLLYLAENP